MRSRPIIGSKRGSSWRRCASTSSARVSPKTSGTGPAMGSYYDVRRASDKAFAVAGVDSRTLMIRQVWGARVLQGGSSPPDCEANDRWTFTVLPGEELTDGLAESGTVLKGHVRFRLGKPDRGIGSARVAPAVAIAASSP
jgi:hypothetical protein